MLKFLLAGILVILVVGSFLWWNTNLSAVNPQNKNEVMFIVSPGSGIRAISKDLKSHNLIKSDLVFTLMVQLKGLDKKIQAGDYRLSPSLTSEQIAKEMIKGTEDVWITIPEGKRAEEVISLIKDKLPLYDDSWDSKILDEEGYLFPDTYLIPHNATVDTFVSTLTNTFQERYKEVDNKTNLTQAQIVTLASLIEREARHDEDRPIVSSVMHNRLDIGMALQIDATVQYALGYDQSEQSWWKRELTFDDLKINSPYNTYQRTGLPPGPIASPGIKAMQAAADPDETKYLFYITDKNLVNHYATTLDQHNANIKKYGL